MRLIRDFNESAMRLSEARQRQLVPVSIIICSALLLASIISEPLVAVVILGVVLGGLICAAIIHLIQDSRMNR